MDLLGAKFKGNGNIFVLKRCITCASQFIHYRSLTTHKYIILLQVSYKEYSGKRKNIYVSNFDQSNGLDTFVSNIFKDLQGITKCFKTAYGKSRQDASQNSCYVT